MVSVWNGGSRKKLKTSIAATEMPIATRRCADVAVASTTNRKSSAAMVGFGCSWTARSVTVIAAIASTTANRCERVPPP